MSLGLIRVALASVAALLAFALGHEAALSNGEISIDVTAAGRTSVPQGAPFSFQVKVTNETTTTETATVTFALLGPKSRSVSLDRETVTLPEGADWVYKRQIVPAQWFATKGPYRVRAAIRDLDKSSSLSFKVTSSPIRVPRFRHVSDTVGLEGPINDWECGSSAGAAWGDVDGDGDLDLFVPRRLSPPSMWINEDDGFVDEASARGLAGQGLGAAFADYDNDGDQDLYVVNDGLRDSTGNRLYRNDGSGFFQDVTVEAGVQNGGLSESATWGDYDNDGDLDLYVANGIYGCQPKTQSVVDTLYRNEGDGTFTNQTALLQATGFADAHTYTAVWFDYDWDGDVDLYLGNDDRQKAAARNYLWRNDGADPAGVWQFREVALEVGAGVSINTMGIGIGDYDRDLDLDIAMSNIYAPVLLANEEGTYVDRAAQARLDRDYQSASVRAITWATAFHDFNNDGWEDLYLSAGGIGKVEEVTQKGDQPDAVYTNARNGRFLDHSAPSGVNDVGVGRGAAFGDYDDDGRVDFLLANFAETPALYHNVTRSRRAHWLTIDTVGTVSNRDGCGARLILTVGRAQLMRQILCGGTSLAAGSDSRAYFGLGAKTAANKLVVMWPSGARQVMQNLEANRVLTVKEPEETGE